MKSIEEVKKAAQDAEAVLLRYPNVNALGIGYKETAGIPTNELSIHVLVDEKKDDILDSERIPSEINGIKTDVIKRDRKVFPHSMDTNTYTTIQGGIACGKFPEYTGTIGAIVVDNATKELMILSNYHVLAVDNTHKEGDPIFQPPGTEHLIAQLKYAALTGNIDAAVATINNSSNVHCTIMEVAEAGVKGVVDASEVMVEKSSVTKRGITTRVTNGVIQTIITTPITVTYEWCDWQVTDQIVIKGNATPFSLPGDSGSCVLNDSGYITGLLVGGPQDGSVTYANRIQNVLQTFNVSICTP